MKRRTMDTSLNECEAEMAIAYAKLLDQVEFERLISKILPPYVAMIVLLRMIRSKQY